MDLSILIPVYNEHVDALVNELDVQLNQFKADSEIVLFDDCSDELYRASLCKLSAKPRIRLINADENIGRSKARNRLLDLAFSDFIIFLDADVQIIKNDFIQSYLDRKDHADCIIGGHIYSSKKPKKDLLLNWRYGKDKESRSFNERQKAPYRSFISMNYACHKSKLKGLKFPDYLDGWGHEDTLLGFLFNKEKVELLHIDNPVLHLGLSPTKSYIEKQEEAINQALIIREKYPDFSFKLLEFYEGINPILRRVIQNNAYLILSIIRKFLICFQSPKILNVYKLIYLSHQYKCR